MYPFITIGSWHLGTFGLLVWLAAVLAGIVLHMTFARDGVEADAMNVVVFVLLAGIAGSKLWHELQSPAELRLTMHQIFLPGRAHPGEIVSGLLEWLRAGFRLVRRLTCRHRYAPLSRQGSQAEWTSGISRRHPHAGSRGSCCGRGLRHWPDRLPCLR